ncbi:MAG: PaaI family thioesterase [Desulfobacterales bacterium]|nr:PaaI family thioesterase [Desulfobacterales bacterium]
MQQPNDNYINKLIEMVNTSPFPHHLRMQLVSISVDQAMVKLKTEQCHLQPFGIVHGGVLATLIDTATFWSVFLRLPEDVGLVNIDLKLNYLKSISTGLMTAEGRCIRAGRSINYAEASIKDKEGNLIAHGTSTLMVLPGKGIRVGAKKFLDQ